jgi:hypothetical protein
VQGKGQPAESLLWWKDSVNWRTLYKDSAADWGQFYKSALAVFLKVIFKQEN